VKSDFSALTAADFRGSVDRQSTDHSTDVHHVHSFELAVDRQSTADSTDLGFRCGPVDRQSTDQNLELTASARSTGSRPGADRPLYPQSTGSRPEVDRQPNSGPVF